MDKIELRTRMSDVRSGLSHEARESEDAAIRAAALALDAWKDAHAIYTYLSFGSEVDTRGLIHAAWEARKTVALPYCVPGTRRMRWFAVDTLDGLVRSRLGVEEPKPDPELELDPRGTSDALALVPGLAFDGLGYRLGYGGGFYDAFLPSFRGTSVGLCRQACLVADLASLGAIEGHDLPVDLVLHGTT